MQVTLPDGTVVTLENVPGRSTVDHFKVPGAHQPCGTGNVVQRTLTRTRASALSAWGAQAYCFRNIPELKGKPLSKYRLEVAQARVLVHRARGHRASALLTPRRQAGLHRTWWRAARAQAKGMALVDFQPLPNAHPVLARQYRTGQPLELCMAEAPVGSPAGTPDKSPVRQSWYAGDLRYGMTRATIATAFGLLRPPAAGAARARTAAGTTRHPSRPPWPRCFRARGRSRS